uniref:Uncharacterized protein n=1 Tax=Rhizophora mucronata TaxID=61149 RepID=A0A2P2QIP8_RHIMU
MVSAYIRFIQVRKQKKIHRTHQHNLFTPGSGAACRQQSLKALAPSAAASCRDICYLSSQVSNSKS